ncbi:MAG: hypothetical protein RIR01_2458 [Bacteroidota bacterium]
MLHNHNHKEYIQLFDMCNFFLLVYFMFSKNKKYDFNYRLPPMADGIATIEDIQKISHFFTESNPVTYAVYLEANKNKLSHDETEKIQNFIRYLSEKEHETMKAVSQYLKTREEYENTMEQIEQKLNEIETETK